MSFSAGVCRGDCGLNLKILEQQSRHNWCDIYGAFGCSVCADEKTNKKAFAVCFHQQMAGLLKHGSPPAVLRCVMTRLLAIAMGGHVKYRPNKRYVFKKRTGKEKGRCRRQHS